jgi:DNA-binding response OmpR family regulator
VKKRALFITDRHPEDKLTELLARSGYQVDVAYCIADGMRAISRSAPSRLILGPLHQVHGIEALLRKLQELDLDVMVLADNEPTAAIAQKMGAPVRWVGVARTLH